MDELARRRLLSPEAFDQAAVVLGPACVNRVPRGAELGKFVSGLDGDKIASLARQSVSQGRAQARGIHEHNVRTRTERSRFIEITPLPSRAIEPIRNRTCAVSSALELPD